jgi:MFS-type transporter involved in bile tolerance (Atg22 family)
VCFGPEDVVGDARVAELIPDAWLARIYALWSIVGKLGAAVAYILVIFLSGVSEKNILMVAGVAYAIVMPLLLARIREK